MRKSLRAVALFGVAALALTSCAKKVSYEEFHKAATAVEKNPYKTAKMTGIIKSSDDSSSSTQNIDAELKYQSIASVGSLSASVWTSDNATAALIINTLTAGIITEDENSTYYAGGSFKVVTKVEEKDSEGKTTATATSTTTFNEYGLLTSIKGKGTGDTSKETFDLKVVYSK